MSIDKLKKRLLRISDRLRLRRDWYLIALAAGIGTVTAVGAVGFKWLLDTATEHGNELHVSLPIWTLPLIPMIGALFTGILVYYFAPEAKGHGVPEVMDALYRKQSRIRPRVALVKSIASVCTIGSGGSAGAEGPIVQIGSAIGSWLSQLLRIPRDQAATLLGCGAAAGISAVFNAPIAGVFFVLEILLRDFSLRTFTPIVVASVFSAATMQFVLPQGHEAIFAITGELEEYKFTFPEFPSYALLGLVCGFVAVGFTRLLYFVEDAYAKLRTHPIIKPVTGALLLGLLGMLYLPLANANATEEIDAPHFFGNGYPTITALLDPTSFDNADAPQPGAEQAEDDVMIGMSDEEAEPAAEPATVSTGLWMLMLLLGCKAVATCMTLGSGGSGGIFAPSLFLGAAAGAAFGTGLEMIGLVPEQGSPAAYALVGMAAVVAGTTHAPLTAILILFELTRDYYVLLPIMLAAVIAVLVAQLLMRDSIYTLKLRRHGVLLGTHADLTLLRKLTARDVTPVPHVAVHPEEPLSKLFNLQDVYKVSDFVVADHEGRYLGMVTAQDLRTALIEREAIPYLLVEELLRRNLPTIKPDETLDIVLEKFSKHDVGSLVLLEADRQGETDNRPAGLITRSRLMKRYRDVLRQRH